jgi:hypothetical protein
VAVTLALAYPEAKTIHLVLDNLNIHRRQALADIFGAEMAAEVWDRFIGDPHLGSWTGPSHANPRQLAESSGD